MNRWRASACCAVAAAALGVVVGSRGGTVVVVHQIGRTFSQAAIQIARGDTINFSNDDTFDHQIKIDSPSFQFESPEQEPGTVTKVVFPTAGTFQVRCEIHPRMLLTVTVQ